jgi:anti-sigma regulatory factor (Ser/Thr protein kinase)
MNVVEITIVNQGSEIARVAALLDQLGTERHLVPEMVADMHIALDEVLTNITKYAYTDNAEHKIHIRFRVLDNVLEAVIEDDGAPFDPLVVPAPDVSAPLRERQVGGVGIHFVRCLVDEVTYKHVCGRNRLVLKKRCRT